MLEIVKVIENERKKKAWSSYRIEKESGLAIGTLRSWRNGVNPKYESVERALIVLGVSYTIGAVQQPQKGKK